MSQHERAPCAGRGPPVARRCAGTPPHSCVAASIVVRASCARDCLAGCLTLCTPSFLGIRAFQRGAQSPLHDSTLWGNQFTHTSNQRRHPLSPPGPAGCGPSNAFALLCRSCVSCAKVRSPCTRARSRQHNANMLSCLLLSCFEAAERGCCSNLLVELLIMLLYDLHEHPGCQKTQYTDPVPAIEQHSHENYDNLREHNKCTHT